MGRRYSDENVKVWFDGKLSTIRQLRETYDDILLESRIKEALNDHQNLLEKLRDTKRPLKSKEMLDVLEASKAKVIISNLCNLGLIASFLVGREVYYLLTEKGKERLTCSIGCLKE